MQGTVLLNTGVPEGSCDQGPQSKRALLTLTICRIMPKDFPDLKVAEHDDEGKRVESLEVRKRRERATKL